MSGAGKLVPSSGTYLCSMQGNMCRIMTLGGGNPLPIKNGESSCKRYVKRLFLARHETSSGYMDNKSKLGRQNKAQENKQNS